MGKYSNQVFSTKAKNFLNNNLIFDSCYRILFPGGDADLTSNIGYAQVGRYVYEIANDMNKNSKSIYRLSMIIIKTELR